MKQSTLMLLIALANELFIIVRKLDNIVRIIHVFVARQSSRNYPLSTHLLISITPRIVARKKIYVNSQTLVQAQAHYVATIVHFLMLAGFTPTSTYIDGALHPTRYAFLRLRNDCPPAFCAKDEGFACELCGHYGFIRSPVGRDSSQRNPVDLFLLVQQPSRLPLAHKLAIRAFAKSIRDNRWITLEVN